MRLCDLHSGLGKLAHAFAELKDRWRAAQEVWHDEASRGFEENHMARIPIELERLLAATTRLTEVLEKAEKECEDREDEGYL